MSAVHGAAKAGDDDRLAETATSHGLNNGGHAWREHWLLGG